MAGSATKESYLMRRYDLLGSMKQSLNPFLMQDSEFTYLRNVSFDEIGSISKDGGMFQLGADVEASGEVDLLHDYIDSTGGHHLLVIANGNLYERGATTWDSLDSTSLTADAKCSATNVMGVCYITNNVDGLHYTEGAELTSVAADNGSAEVRGEYIVSLHGDLYLGKLSGVHGANELVYTISGGRTFYNPTEEGADTYETTNNIVSLNDSITGLVAYQGSIIIFTEEDMYLLNYSTFELTTIAHIGCTDHFSIQEINGVLYWINRDGVYRFNGEDLPQVISLPITNWATSSLWRLITGGSWGHNPAVSFEGKYMVYVGNMSTTLPGDETTMENVVLVYDTLRDVWYFLTDYPVSRFTRYINSDGNLRLAIGAKGESAVFVKGFTYQNDGAAIKMVVRTKYFHFDMPENEKTLTDLFVTYRPEGESAKYITIKTATNGTNNYEERIGSTTPAKLELDGVLGTDHQLERVSMNGLRARSISYEFRNEDDEVNMTILGYAQRYKYMENNMNVSV